MVFILPDVPWASFICDLVSVINTRKWCIITPNILFLPFSFLIWYFNYTSTMHFEIPPILECYVCMCLCFHSLFSLHFILWSFYWHIFKFIISHLDHIQSKAFSLSITVLLISSISSWLCLGQLISVYTAYLFLHSV